MKNEKGPKTVREKRFSGSESRKLIRKGRPTILKSQKIGLEKKLRKKLDMHIFLKIEVAVLNF